MSQGSPTFGELQALLELLCRGNITAAQMRRIEQLARESRESRRFFSQYLRMHGALAWHYRDTPYVGSPSSAAGTSTLIFLTASTSQFLGSFGLPLKMLVVAVALGFWAFWAFVIEADREQLAKRPVAGVADILQVGPDCRVAGAKPLATGKRLAIGELLAIEAGQIEFSLASGVRGILEGPAQLQISSSNSGYLRLGKLTARVPRKAIGFAVETPTARIVDQGTEFGVEVDRQGRTDVQVFDGAVDFSLRSADVQRPASGKTRRLTSGQAARTTDVPSEVTPAVFQSDKFVRKVDPRQRKQHEVAIDLKNAEATQSSLYPGGLYLPRAAVDGDLGTFSHTATPLKESAWWRLNLGETRGVASLILNNDPSRRGWLRDITVKLLAEDGTTVVAKSPKLNPKNILGEGEEDFDNGPSKLVFDFPRVDGAAPRGRFLVVEREPTTLDPARMKTERGSGYLSHCRADLVLAEVEVFELQPFPVRERDEKP